MIIDFKEIILGLSILNLESYLNAQGWFLTGNIHGKAIVLQHVGFPKELILPLRKNFVDFTIRIAELLQTLSEFENRQIQSIVSDINRSGFDIFRIKITEGAHDGTIPLLTTAEIIYNSKEMLLAAASATKMPRKLYSSRKSDEAVNYLNAVRVGQTEYGSYVLTFLSPVGPNSSKELCLFDDMDLYHNSFERQAVKMLFKGLNAAKNAADETSINGNMEPFERAIPSGVSANLCDAIANIVKNAGNAEFSLTWANLKPFPDPIFVEKTFINRHNAEIIAEAAVYFRLNEPLLGQPLTGWIYQLRQEQSDLEGTVYLQTIINNKPKKIKVVLSENDYQIAMRAHINKSPIMLEGDLYQIGKTAELKNPKNLIIDDRDE